MKSEAAIIALQVLWGARESIGRVRFKLMWGLAPPVLKGGWEGFTGSAMLQVFAHAGAANPPHPPFFSKG